MSSLLPVYLTSPHSLTRNMEEGALSEREFHACQSQCDMCHTQENCVPATLRYEDLTLCVDCYRETVTRNGPAALVSYFED